MSCAGFLMGDPRCDPYRRRMPPEEWPMGDQAAWAGARRPGTLRRRAGAAAKWRQATLTKVAKAYGRWCTFLDLHGWLDRDKTPSERITEERIAAYVAELEQQVVIITLKGLILDLAESIRVMCPNANIAWLYDLATQLAVVAKPSRAKWAKLQSTEKLVELGINLMEQTFEPARKYRQARYRDIQYAAGLMIALLAHRPLRRRTFTGLCIEKQLKRMETGYVFELGPDDVKAGDTVR